MNLRYEFDPRWAHIFLVKGIQTNTMIRCTTPTYDPRLGVRLMESGCTPTYFNSTETPFRRTWSPSTTVSDMSQACFWPCADLHVSKEIWIDSWSVACVVLGTAGVLASRSVSRSRSVWILVCMCLSVVFSVVIVGYATSRMWKNELSYSGVGTLTAVQVLLGFVLQKTWGWVEEYTHWVAAYVGAFALLGLALGRGFVPADVDPRAAVAMETVWTFMSLVVCVVHTPSMAVACIQCGVLVYLKTWWDWYDAAQYYAMASLMTRTEVAKLVETSEFKTWLSKNHMRLRLVR